LRRAAWRGQDRRVRAVIAICLASSVLTGCDPAPPTAPDVPVHRLGDTFTTTRQKGEMFEGGFGVAFLDVMEDSRCPQNVTCVWQGAATVRLSMIAKSGQKEPQWMDLATAPEPKRSVLYEGYRVELIDVMPYPEGATKPAPVDYQVSLRVTRVP
jgi:hypothetical protein